VHQAHTYTLSFISSGARKCSGLVALHTCQLDAVVALHCAVCANWTDPFTCCLCTALQSGCVPLQLLKGATKLR
jgi:hypothetical protein